MIVGQLTLQVPHKIYKTEDMLWLTSLSVDPKYKNQGIGKELVDHLFKWLQEHNKTIVSSYYETEGDKFIKHVLRRVATKYKIRFVDKERIDYSEVYMEWGNGFSGRKLSDPYLVT